jgi:hypothetical protein
MSHVANILVVSGSMHSDELATALANVWRVLNRADTPPCEVTASGGDKAVEAAVFIGAHNHLDSEQFLAAFRAEMLRTLEWGDCVQVFIKDEPEDRFCVHVFEVDLVSS